MITIRFRRLWPVAALASSLFFTPCLAQAQNDNGQPPAGHDHARAMMKELRKLNLSSSQWQQIKSLNASFKAAHGANNPPSQADMQAHHQAMMAILTQDQQNQFKNDMAAMHAGH